MVAQQHAILMADPTWLVREMPVGDRLEAALDAALAESARDAWRVWPKSKEVMVTVPLTSIRAWLCHTGHRREHGEWKHEWTKRDVELLFASRVGVRDRYIAGGWSKCECWWESQQARSIIFAFLTESGVRNKEKEVDKEKAIAADVTLGVRAMMAIIELGDALGVKRDGWMQMHISGVAEDTVRHLEDLRLAAKLQRFDLEAMRREADEKPGPGHYPPSEGSPDDENFGE